jgi:hypothetical protein
MTEKEALSLFERADAEKAQRAADMPNDKAALSAMFTGYQRLEELGWRDAIYCPKDGTVFDAIEPGSTGIHDCHYMGEWPNGSWWVHEAGDLWPSHPCLFRLKTAKNPPSESKWPANPGIRTPLTW